MAEQEQPLQIQINEEVARGRYANNLYITAVSPEEFTLDFMLMGMMGQTPSQSLVSRVIVSPGHLKRMAAYLQQILAGYEAQMGQLEAAQEPRNQIGFKTD